MKKRCTNSACRKSFIADSVCPYCGKRYPRLPSLNYDVYLVDSGNRKFQTLKIFLELNKGISVLEGKRMVVNCPCIIGKGLPKKEAELWCNELLKVGAIAKIL